MQRLDQSMCGLDAGQPHASGDRLGDVGELFAQLGSPRGGGDHNNALIAVAAASPEAPSSRSTAVDPMRAAGWRIELSGITAASAKSMSS